MMSRRAARPEAHSARRGRHDQHRRQRGHGCSRSPARIGDAAGQRQRGVARERQQRRRNRAGKNHRRVDHREAAEDVVTKSAGANRRRDGGRADANHHGDAKARHDRRQRERPFDLRQHLAGRQAHRDRAFDHRRRHTLNAGDRAAQHRQDGIDRERDERGARADAADERQRNQETEQRQAWNGLRQVGERDDRFRERRPPRREDAERNADRRRNRRRCQHQHHVLAKPRDEFGAMRSDEGDQVGHPPSLLWSFGVTGRVATSAATRGSEEARTTAGVSHATIRRRRAPRHDRRARTLPPCRA